MSEKEKLIDEQKSETYENSEDGKPEKQKSADSKSKKEPSKDEQKSSKDKKVKFNGSSSEDEEPEKQKSADSESKKESAKGEQKTSKDGIEKASEDKSDLAEEINEQEEFLKKQEKLLEYVANIEKEQSKHSHIRPCHSCELLKPYPKSEAFNKLKEKTEAKRLSLNYKLHIPELKIGTLDELMYLIEELKILDNFTEDIIHKFVEFVHQVLGGSENLHEFFEVNGMNVPTYITRFTWNPAKYGPKKPLSVLHDLLRVEMRKLGENLKSRMEDYQELDRSLEKIEKQQTGSLLTRSLASIVKKEHFILDSGYLTTLLVVVPKEEEKKWLKSYHTFADMVVPKSAVKIFEDKTHLLYTVVLCKKNMEDFKNNARDQKCLVRDFEYCEEELDEEKDIQKKLRNLKKAKLLFFADG
ncbi:V-type proton ATPase subunit C 1-B like protein [Argiope bruennichi]|uniref:V-type proton ATPase subunit C n=1 Tax=Argiope bruennichi TaxID=94029 RepID=A0A8T0EIV4_ARGBR|nr:V-type proton ATPase subunit C 1-B like protein [Argiope bruennichi]